ncbi:ester cyclase [Estrella lausannensis]|uniref:Ester cyclase n=1 Tax=Estrella lausannensis TaxID=483423 RepID=A0A0H5E4I3_9BACT|nr:ester cyclase [Estrella lausannensis]CRX38120.1 Conserved hypothetical protein [Estrella lausannensis]
MTEGIKKESTAKDIAMEYVQRIWDEKDMTAIDTLMAEEIVIHSSFGYYQGRAKMREVVSAYYSAFPDLKVSNDFIISEGDKTMIHWQASGTHLGNFKELPPRGKKISYTGVTIYRTAHEKIVEYWAYVDLHYLMQQLK